MGGEIFQSKGLEDGTSCHDMKSLREENESLRGRVSTLECEVNERKGREITLQREVNELKAKLYF